MTTKTDVLIVGGGMVGLAMALSLVETGLKITVIERDALSSLSSQSWAPEKFLDPIQNDPNTYDIRVSAISPGNQKMLDALGVWKLIPANRRADYEKMCVWDGNGSGLINFDAAELAEPMLGSIAENRILRAALYQRTLNHSNLTILDKVSIDAINNREKSVEIMLSDGTSQVARLLIGSDGANSEVRRQLGISVASRPYRQQAFVANVTTELPHQNTAWQRFIESGPVAFLPLPEPNLCSVVWSVDDNLAKGLQSLDRDQFADRWGRACEKRLGGLKLVSEFRSFPLISQHAETYLAQSTVLIGDAAHTIHPLAGQGVNLGFQDVACLGGHIIKLVKKQRDFGLMANLRRFERERKAENSVMQHAMTGFKRLFETQSLPVTLLRNIGLAQMNKSTLIKRAIIHRAMGR